MSNAQWATILFFVIINALYLALGWVRERLIARNRLLRLMELVLYVRDASNDPAEVRRLADEAEVWAFKEAR